MDIHNYRWPMEEAQEDIYRIWKQVRKRVVALILKRIENEKDIPFLDEVEDFEPDWHYPEDWRVITKNHVVYTCQGNYVDSEHLTYMEGKLNIMRLGEIELTPSFKFILDNKKLFVDVETIRKVMQDQKRKEDNSAWIQLGPEVFSESLRGYEDPQLSSNNERDLRNAYKKMGFSEDEINLMVHNVVANENFTEDMEIGKMFMLGISGK